MKDFLQERKRFTPLNGFSPIRSSAGAPQGSLPDLQTPARPRESASFSETAAEPAAHRGCANAASGTKAEASVEVIQNDGRIEQIVVTCPCGEKITVYCTY